MDDTVNINGLTLNEWITAAGYFEVDLKKLVENCPHFNILDYAAKIRAAWKAGEDPTEHKANSL